MTYLAANIIGAIPWLILFLSKKDLRKEMTLMGLLAMPISFFDLLYVPTYWVPTTLFNIPIGIEGFIFSFEIGGVTAAIFSQITNQIPVKINSKLRLLSFSALLCVLPVAFLFNYLFPINIAIGIQIGLLAGIILIYLLRKDLLKNLMLTGASFGLLYFLSTAIWIFLFPEAKQWFTLVNLPHISLLNVPIYEIVFG